MKNILLPILLAAFTVTAVAQQDAATLNVDITKLSQQELLDYQKLKQKEAATKFSIQNLTPENINKYAEIGEAFGTAFKTCWDTVSDDAEKFAQSDAGKLTMILIAWKIMGDDAIGLVEKSVQYTIGTLMIFVGTIFFIYIFRRNCMRHPALVSKTKIGFLTWKSEYKGMNNALHGEDGAPILYGIAYLVLIGVSCLVLFAG